jgi:glycosyltransferase involved in cell wall biosynthesis
VKLLLCSSTRIDRRLGYSKTLIEIGEAMERLGWRCRLAADDEICPDIRRYSPGRGSLEFSFALARFIRAHGNEFDVVDYDHAALPFARATFPASTLLVARSVLLNHHFETIRIPGLPGVRSWAGVVVKGPLRYSYMKLNVWRSTRTMRAADLVNVSNDDDLKELVRRGFDPANIMVAPLGITEASWESLASTGPANAAAARVAFIGTFDARKGACDLPAILGEIAKAVPTCRFRFLGARYRTADEIRRFFPQSLRPKLEIVSEFEPDALPGLLRDCSLGIFPSYLEGFGIGVAEMLAASLPVVAYDAPGPPMMLPPEFLVPRGAARELASKAIALLGDPARLSVASAWARRRARDFTWDGAARTTSAVYAERVQRLRAARVAGPLDGFAGDSHGE